MAGRIGVPGSIRGIPPRAGARRGEEKAATRASQRRIKACIDFYRRKSGGAHAGRCRVRRFWHSSPTAPDGAVGAAGRGGHHRHRRGQRRAVGHAPNPATVTAGQDRGVAQHRYDDTPRGARRPRTRHREHRAGTVQRTDDAPGVRSVSLHDSSVDGGRDRGGPVSSESAIHPGFRGRSESLFERGKRESEVGYRAAGCSRGQRRIRDRRAGATRSRGGALRRGGAARAGDDPRGGRTCSRIRRIVPARC